jgi:hypothetical protein
LVAAARRESGAPLTRAQFPQAAQSFRAPRGPAPPLPPRTPLNYRKPDFLRDVALPLFEPWYIRAFGERARRGAFARVCARLRAWPSAHTLGAQARSSSAQ